MNVNGCFQAILLMQFDLFPGITILSEKRMGFLSIRSCLDCKNGILHNKMEPKKCLNVY